ncbi:MAG: hypothetical protein NTZ03_05225 [Actinobacteria bacterium]|nr:hypothetical protein [Actinomycetota bacterium]
MTETPPEPRMGPETPATSTRSTRRTRCRWSAVAAVVALVLIGSMAGYSAGRGQSGAQAGALTSAGANASIISGSATTLRNNQIMFFGFGATAASTNEALVQMTMPTAGTISNLCISLSLAPANGTALWQFTLRKNHDSTSTPVTVLIGGPNPVAYECDQSNKLTFDAGDQLSISSSPQGSPADTPSVTWTAAFVPSA